MFSSVIYLELFGAVFFLPGFFLTIILGIKKFRFLLTLALSYSLFMLTLLPFEYYAQPIVRWERCVLLVWVILAASAVVKMFMSRSSKTLNIQCWMLSVQSFCHRQPVLIRRLFNPRLIIPLALAGVICGYLAYAGIYLEIPSDAWDHWLWFQWHKLSVIDIGIFPAGPWFNSVFVNQNFRWHFIHPWLCQVSGLAIMDSLHVLTLVNVLIFLLAIYFFSLFLFSGLHISALKKMVMAAFASLFTGATMGNMVFAYIRYYALAPTILNYVLFLAAMAVIITWLRSNRWFGHALWIAPVLLIVTNAMHTQEALFIFFMTLALGIVETARILWRKIIYWQTYHLLRHTETLASAGQAMKPLLTPAFRPSQGYGGQVGHPSKGRELTQSSPASSETAPRRDLIPYWPACNAMRSIVGREEQGGGNNHWSVREWKTVILTIVLLIVFFAGFAVVRHFKPGSWVSPNMIMPQVCIPPEPVNFIFRNLIISVPENLYIRLAVYQLFVFYQVIGLWGLFVYLLFALMIRHFIKIPYLMAGMVIVPFLTAFNPLTVDMMARLGQDVTVYRFHYLIPLPFIGGYLFVHFWGKAREWFQKMRLSPAQSVSSIWPRLSWINFVGCILVIAGLVGFMFPIDAAGIYAPYSKIYTLRKIPAGNDYHLYDDLGKIMAKHENKVVLTDSWTTRFLWCYSPKNTYHVPWVNSSNPEKEPPEPYTWEKIRNRGLIIINRRNGSSSITGKISKHWPEDVLLKVSRYYSFETQNYLESHPEKFQKIWSQNRIAIYAVR